MRNYYFVFLFVSPVLGCYYWQIGAKVANKHRPRSLALSALSLFLPLTRLTVCIQRKQIKMNIKSSRDWRRRRRHHARAPRQRKTMQLILIRFFECNFITRQYCLAHWLTGWLTGARSPSFFPCDQSTKEYMNRQRHSSTHPCMCRCEFTFRSIKAMSHLDAINLDHLCCFQTDYAPFRFCSQLQWLQSGFTFTILELVFVCHRVDQLCVVCANVPTLSALMDALSEADKKVAIICLIITCKVNRRLFGPFGLLILILIYFIRQRFRHPNGKRTRASKMFSSKNEDIVVVAIAAAAVVVIWHLMIC